MKPCHIYRSIPESADWKTGLILLIQLSCKCRLSFFKECTKAFLGVTADGRQGKMIHFNTTTGLQICIKAVVDRLLGSPDRHHALGGDRLGGFHHVIHQRLGRTNPVDKPDLLGFGGGNHLAG